MSDAAKRLKIDDPIPHEVRRRLEQIYGDRMSRVVLFGSRARGDYRPDSDYDIAVFLRGYDGSWNEVTRMADLSYELLLEQDWDVSIKVFAPDEWDVDTLFMRHMHRDAIDL